MTLTKLIIHADSREALVKLEENSLEACVCDPPYHLTSITKRVGKAGSAEIQFGTDGAFQRATKGFMSETWDGADDKGVMIAFDPLFWAEVLRVLKPGGHLLAMGGTRTYHRLTCAIEDAGFDIRDTITWHYASGMPKPKSVPLFIDKELGAIGNRGHAIAMASATHPTTGKDLASGGALGKYAPITDAAKEWEGWDIALKPASELICLARKPISESSIARNILKWGTGGLNVDSCRIAGLVDSMPASRNVSGYGSNGLIQGETHKPKESIGRWPANIILNCSCDGQHLEGCPVRTIDEQGGERNTGDIPSGTQIEHPMFGGGLSLRAGCIGDNGTASRFFFTSKPSKAEKGEKNIHPTVKPVSLMSYLCRLICPPGGTVLDPFGGSGTTAVACEIEGFGYVIIEREAKYIPIIKGRTGQAFMYVDDEEEAKTGQSNLFTEAL